MENFFKEIDQFIIESNKEINEKIVGINYLEKLKFSLIERIINLNVKSYEEFKNFEEIKEYNNIKLRITFNHYNEALSKLKNPLPNDNLCIILRGLKTFTVTNNKESKNFTLYPNMGITLPSKTNVNESIAKQSTIIDIFSLNENLGVEK
tara:strand:+ start:1194 stop:1643 length:450 start_codon:yes stop_codon:yes gene_type:complete